MAKAFQYLHNKSFDVIVIGAGINGASAIQNLVAEGYRCLIIDKGDFASGATGFSSRMLHCGLRYFEAPNPILHFGLKPSRFMNSLRMARESMLAVSEIVADSGDRVWPYTMCFPIYKGSSFKQWHLDIGFKLLSVLGDGKVPLDYQKISGNFSDKIPFANDFRDIQNLQSLTCYREYKFDWPERFCIDMLLDAEKNGAVLENYCAGQLGNQCKNGTWEVELTSTLNPALEPAIIQGRIVLNMAGTWADEVLPEHNPRLVQGTKGAHIVVRLPSEYKGFGIATINRIGQPFYILPLYDDYYSIGVTETLFEGDAANVYTSDEDIDFLINEASYVLPKRKFSRKDIQKTWAGVRPLTYSPTEPMGARARTLHDLTNRGFPGVYALTAGPIMTHRSAGRLILDTIKKKISSSEPKRKLSFNPFQYSQTTSTTSFLSDFPDVSVTDLEQSARGEHCKTLADVLIRRTGVAWRHNLTRDEVTEASKIIGKVLQWDEKEQAKQCETYMKFQERIFKVKTTE